LGTVSSQTGRAIRINAARRCGWAEDFTGSTTGGVAATLIDTANLIDSAAPARRYEGYWIFIPTISGNGNGNSRRVITDDPATGTLTVQANWTTGALVAATAFELYKALTTGAAPVTTTWFRCLNRALVKCLYQSETIIGYTPGDDWDMEAAGIGSWTASGGPTVTKATGAANSVFGSQSLRVANTLAGGYAQSVTINVPSGYSMIVTAIGRSNSGTGTLVVRDITNGADISLANTALQINSVNQKDWTVVTAQFVVPSTCTQIAIRLTGAEATADIYWDCVQVLLQNRNEYDLPTWVSETWRNLAIGYRPISTQLPVRNIFSGFVETGSDVYSEIPGAHPIVARLDASPGLGLWTVQGLRSYSALSADTDSVTIDDEWIETMTIAEFYDLLANTGPADGRATYAKDAVYWRKRANALTPQHQTRPSLKWRRPLVYSSAGGARG